MFVSSRPRPWQKTSLESESKVLLQPLNNFSDVFGKIVIFMKMKEDFTVRLHNGCRV